MEKQSKWTIAALIVAALLIVGMILIIIQLGQIKERVGANQAAEYGTVQEAPSILADHSEDYAGEDTVSTEKGTVNLQVSFTPLEFKKNTKATVKINGKTYQLKQSGNAFIGAFPVSAFERSEISEVVFEDEESIRTEPLEGGGEPALLPISFSWTAAGEIPKIEKETVSIKQPMNLNDTEGEETEFSSAQVIGVIEGKQVYKKNYTLENTSGVSLGFDWEAEIPLPKGKTLEIYVDTKDKFGFVYRYKFGELRQGSEIEGWFGETTLEVISPQGKTLLNKKTEEIMEEY